MTPALRGNPKLADNSGKSRDWDSDKWGGGQKVPKLCGGHLWMVPEISHELGGQFEAPFQIEAPYSRSFSLRSQRNRQALL